jgi:hypothetical protein
MNPKDRMAAMIAGGTTNPNNPPLGEYLTKRFAANRLPPLPPNHYPGMETIQNPDFYVSRNQLRSASPRSPIMNGFTQSGQVWAEQDMAKSPASYPDDYQTMNTNPFTNKIKKWR